MCGKIGESEDNELPWTKWMSRKQSNWNESERINRKFIRGACQNEQCWWASRMTTDEEKVLQERRSWRDL